MKTLFVLSLPRSLSTLVYHAARLSLELNEPTWTSDGEIMNNDRYIHYAGKGYDEGLKYIREEKEPEIFNRLSAFLDQAAAPEGFIYKDVVHPFVVSRWLNTREIQVLKIKRPLADVAFSMLTKQWYYPAMAADEKNSIDNIEAAVIQGLVLAEKAIDQAPGETIAYDILVQDEQIITKVLERLYPEENVIPMGFIDDDFRRQGQQVLERRKTGIYKKIEEKITLQKEKYSKI